MTHARTLPRYVGIAGLVAGLLAPVSSLAAVNSNGIEILSTTSTGVKTGQYIEAAASVRYSHVNTAERIYTRQLVPVARSTLRVGALAALNAGRLLPGLGLAVTAAGFIIGNSDSEPQVMVPSETDLTPYEDIDSDSNNFSYANVVYDHVASACEASTPDDAIIDYVNQSPGSSVLYCYFRMYPGGPIQSGDPVQVTNTEPDVYFEPGYSPASESDLATIDDHLPASIVDDLWFNEEPPYPQEWADTNDSIDPDLNDITDAKGSSAPEVRQKAKQWAENVAAQLEGQPKPNPDTDTDTKTADEAAYEDSLQDREQPIPPFADVDPEWQVETVDSLPDYNIGLGSGSCPGPTVIALPAPFGGSLSLDWQPLCDFASMIRGAVIAVCMILSLYIVLRST